MEKRTKKINNYIDLQFAHESVSGKTIGSICVSSGSNLFIGSGAIVDLLTDNCNQFHSIVQKI